MFLSNESDSYVLPVQFYMIVVILFYVY